MASNLHIDEKLLAAAVKVGGKKTKRATVEDALREYVAYKKQIKVLDLAGTIEYAPGEDPLSRRRRERTRPRRTKHRWA